jgi:luciferase family oxidoreductase group 1
MTVPLSVLDLSPVSMDGGTQAQGVRNTIEVAKAAERLGYKRFWVAEHHSIEHLSSASPEVLIAAMTQVTSRIRLGSGGVMLPNYSPLKVAEGSCSSRRWRRDGSISASAGRWARTP